jgi:tRNA A-37 threonylcarbamoyl transferase component Bud32
MRVSSQCNKNIVPMVPEGELDLVCIHPEKGFNTSYAPMNLLVGYFTLLGFAVTSILFSLFALSDFRSSLSTQVFALIFGSAIGLSGYVLMQIRFAFPTNLLCHASGLSLAWRTDTNKESVPILWDSIVDASVSVYKSGKEEFQILELKIKRSSYGLFHWIGLVGQTVILWSGSPVKGSGFGFDTLTLQFPLHAFTLETDRMRLLSFLKEKVNPSLISEDLLAAANSKGIPTYTQLWLDDLQSFRRERTGALPPGTALKGDRFVVDDLLATGGQARIYRATDTAFDTRVVLKEFVLPTNAGAEVRNKSFASIKNEANFLSGLDHPLVVRLLDNFVEDHRAYLVMEFIEGDTLRNLVKAQGPQPQSVVVKIMASICELCSYLHHQAPPIVHRDLAPDNMIFTPDGAVKLIDFSVAQHFEADRTRTVSGKHNYMAPEQFKGEPTTQSDLYALGGTIYFLLTGSDPLPLSCLTLPAELPVSADLRAIVSKLTRLELGERYSCAEDVLKDLEPLLMACLPVSAAS